MKNLFIMRKCCFHWMLSGAIVLLFLPIALCESAGAETYNYVSSIGSYGSGDGQFYQPYGIDIDASGYIYVADTYNNRIQKFSSDGTYVIQWGSSGTGNGQFDNPGGVSVDTSGIVYVADTYNNRIQKFSPMGHMSPCGALPARGMVSSNSPIVLPRTPPGTST